MPDETVRFSLADSNGDPISGVVTVNGTAYQTDADGRVNVTFAEVGTFTATGQTDETNTTVYLDDTAEISVTSPPTFAITYAVESNTVTVDEPVTVTATVENTGGVAGTTTVAFYADGVKFATESTTVAGGNTTEESASTRFNETGTHNVTVNDLNATEITVEEIDAVYDPDSMAAQYDENGDGEISLTELGDAAADYASDEITLHELADVAKAYARS